MFLYADCTGGLAVTVPAREGAVLELSLDPEDALPLVEQIVGRVRSLIDDRVLRGGARLPPIRQFALRYGVSRFTVVEAYDRLVAQGYLCSRRGSGFFVASPRVEHEASAALPSLPERAVDVAWAMRRALDAGEDVLCASAGWLPESWQEDEAIRRQLRLLARGESVRLTRYGSAQGYLPLRQHLCVRMADLDIAVRPEQVVLTQGATQALDLAARYLIRPGDVVLVDDPGYYNFFGNLRLLGARLIGVPRHENGPDTEALARLAAEHRPRLFFTHSALHNPTGSDLSAAVAYRVLQLAEQHDFTLIEDDTYCDFQTTPSTRLAALDQLNRVVYVGSFSKTLSANLRVGYLAAKPELARALGDVKTLCAVATSELAEQAVLGVLVAGQFRRQIESLRQRLDAARASTRRMLERTGFEIFHEPRGGMFLWARRPEDDDAGPLVERAGKAGIVLAPGSIFRPQMQASPYIRINVAYGADQRLEPFLQSVAA